MLLDYAKSGDAMMTFLKFVQGIKQNGKKVSELFPLFENDFLYYENFKASSKDMFKRIAGKEELQSLGDELGKQIKGHGRVVIHSSVTEPKIRIWVCGDDKDKVEDFGHVLWKKIDSLSKIV